MEQQIHRLVVGILQAVAVVATSPVEAGDGVAQPVPQGHQFGQGAVVIFVFMLVGMFIRVIVDVLVVILAHGVSLVVRRFSRVRR